MRLTVVVDNHCDRSGLFAEWGYCAHLATPDGNILLDTGGYGRFPVRNMRELGLSPETVSHIVLSHGHYDHVSGLADVLEAAPGATVWGGAGIGTERRGDADAKRLNGGATLFDVSRVTEIRGEKEIFPGVTAFIVPQERRDPRYQSGRGLWEVRDGAVVPDTFADDLSLLVKGDGGFSLLLGCAHTGLVNILDYVASRFGVESLDAVVGGTHLSAFDAEGLALCVERFRDFSVRRWRPNHCTGFAAAAAMAGVFKDVCWAGAGSVIDL